MDEFSRVFIPTALWPGIATSAQAMLFVVFCIRFPETLIPGGIVRGTQISLLVAMVAYCAHKTPRHP